MTDVSELFVSTESTIRNAIERIDRTGSGIALVVTPDRRLLATITDGDVRRALLAGTSIDSSVQNLLDRKPEDSPHAPTIAAAGMGHADLLELMNRHDVRHIPLVDRDGCVVDIALLKDLVHEYDLPLRALVMAGGYGTRLRPLTDEVPKSMLPVGDRPLLEIIVRQLEQAGIRRVNLATHYRGDVIEQHFGDGGRFNVDIRYVNEDEPLGTAGALGLLERSDEPLLVINGDILTQVNFAAMLEFHRANRAEMTVAVRPFEMQVPFGVIKTDGLNVTGIDEKPVIRSFINAGIYLLNPDLCRVMPEGERYDMPDLIARVAAAGHRVISFLLREYWLDIGHRADYSQAMKDALEGGV
jgi:dTDP-glucose pyrophosphorylase